MAEDTSKLDLQNAEEVIAFVDALVEKVWDNEIRGLPMAVAVNLTSILNANLLASVEDPVTLLYFVEQNAKMIEGVLNKKGEEIGHEKMEKLIETMSEESPNFMVAEADEDDEERVVH